MILLRKELGRCGITTGKFFAWPHRQFGSVDDRVIRDLPCCLLGAMYRLLPADGRDPHIMNALRGSPAYDSLNEWVRVNRHWDSISMWFDTNPEKAIASLDEWAAAEEAE
ncbi:MAG: hypothetical protein E6R03_12655 [Hyphomicrobiaceae bacterium]|nr:MAG: hypothetical protein E6R03_12655 [Hyphomicrobiaceae bacterium]